MPPNLTNAKRRGSWKGAHFGKVAYSKQCDELQNAGLLPPPPATPFPVVTAAVVMYLGSAMDDDNAGARCKWIWDWLKTRGYLADDRRKNLKLAGYPTQRIKRDKNYRVEVTLTPLSALDRRSA